MQEVYDTIIVGGGVIGSSIAFQLAKKKQRVLLVEKSKVGCQASSAAAGMLGAQAEFSEASPLYQIAQLSRSMFYKLSEELKECSGIDIGLVSKGLIKVAQNQDEAEKLKNNITFYQTQGQKAEWISTEELFKKEKNLSRKLVGGMYLPEDGHVLAPELTQAFARSSAHLGVSILEYTETNELIINHGKIQGIITNHGKYFAQNVIITAGVWSGRLIHQTGLNLPLYPVKGECISVRYPSPILTSTIKSGGCYLVPKQNGRLIVGATMVEGTFDPRVTINGIKELLTQTENIFPQILNGAFEKSWSGFRPQTPDGLPYMGEHPKIRRLFIAAGHFRNGILLSPLTGKWMASLIEGELESGLAAPFSPDRFLKQAIF